MKRKRDEEESSPPLLYHDHHKLDFLSLPKDIAIHITSFLCPYELVLLTRTCHWMYDIVTSTTYYLSIPTWNTYRNEFVSRLPDGTPDLHRFEEEIKEGIRRCTSFSPIKIFVQKQDIITLRWLLLHPPRFPSLSKQTAEKIFSECVAVGGLSLLAQVLNRSEENLLSHLTDTPLEVRTSILVGASKRGDHTLVQLMLDHYIFDPYYDTLEECMCGAASIGNLPLIKKFSDLLDELYSLCDIGREKEAMERGYDEERFKDRSDALVHALDKSAKRLNTNVMIYICDLIKQKHDLRKIIRKNPFDFFRKRPSISHSMIIIDFLRKDMGLSYDDVISHLLLHSKIEMVDHILTRIHHGRETIDWNKILVDMLTNRYIGPNLHSIWFCLEKGADWKDSLIWPSVISNTVTLDDGLTWSTLISNHVNFDDQYCYFLCCAVKKGYTTWRKIRSKEGDWTNRAISYVEAKMGKNNVP